MAGEQKEIDFDNLSDEDFLNLSEEDVAEAPPEDTQEEEPVVEDEPKEDEQNGQTDEEIQNGEAPKPVDPPADDLQSDDAQSGIDPHSDTGEKTTPENKPKSDETSKDDEKTGDPKAKAKAKAEETPGEVVKLPEGLTPELAIQAKSFMDTVTATFKADGKDFSVRSAEDAVRLMQQGVNYSRRMHEMKPMKALNRMLADHGLNDTQKLSFLIDVSKGDKTAITKLLKDSNLDPMDLDTSGEIGYQAKSYAGNPQDNAFRDALDNTIATPEGQALVSDIHQNWDAESKDQLRKNPSILGNLTQMKQSGVYSKIVDELNYQKSMGYLTDAPFLQAFDQVGEAMKNAGVLGNQPQPAQAAPLGQLQGNTQNQGQPVATGARKVPASKKPDPNPHLSSAHPSSSATTSKEADFDKLSDEDFLKMPPPT